MYSLTVFSQQINIIYNHLFASDYARIHTFATHVHTETKHTCTQKQNTNAHTNKTHMNTITKHMHTETKHTCIQKQNTHTDRNKTHAHSNKTRMHTETNTRGHNTHAHGNYTPVRMFSYVLLSQIICVYYVRNLTSESRNQISLQEIFLSWFYRHALFLLFAEVSRNLHYWLHWRLHSGKSNMCTDGCAAKCDKQTSFVLSSRFSYIAKVSVLWFQWPCPLFGTYRVRKAWNSMSFFHD